MARAPSSLAGLYLEEALDGLRRAGSPEALWGEVDRWHAGTLLEPAQRRMDAVNRRLQHLRSATIFTALSVEAYANEFLASHFEGRGLEALDSMNLVDKLTLGPTFAGLESPLDRGAEPVQTIEKLRTVRNRLVHSKPGEGAYAHEIDVAKTSREIAPRVVAGYIEQVAHAAVLLHPLRGDRAFEMPFSPVWAERQILTRHAEKIGDGLFDLPDETDAPLRNLFLQMQDRAYKRAEPEMRRRAAERGRDVQRS